MWCDFARGEPPVVAGKPAGFVGRRIATQGAHISVIAALECRGQFPGGSFVARAATVNENGGRDELGVKLSRIDRGWGTGYEEHCARSRRAAGAVGRRK